MRFDVSTDEVGEKNRRITAFLAKHGYAGVIISNTRNFAWATCGRDNHVVRGSDAGVGHALYLADGGKYSIPNTV